MILVILTEHNGHIHRSHFLSHHDTPELSVVNASLIVLALAPVILEAADSHRERLLVVLDIPLAYLLGIRPSPPLGGDPLELKKLVHHTLVQAAAAAFLDVGAINNLNRSQVLLESCLIEGLHGNLLDELVVEVVNGFILRPATLHLFAHIITGHGVVGVRIEDSGGLPFERVALRGGRGHLE